MVLEAEDSMLFERKATLQQSWLRTKIFYNQPTARRSVKLLLTMEMEPCADSFAAVCTDLHQPPQSSLFQPPDLHLQSYRTI